MPDTWLDLATHLEAGDEVVFQSDLEQGAGAAIPEGTSCIVVENGLNEMGCALIVRVPGDDGDIWIPGPGATADAQEWLKPAIVSQILDVTE